MLLFQEAYVEDTRKQRGLEKEKEIKDLPRRLRNNDTRQPGLVHHTLKQLLCSAMFTGIPFLGFKFRGWLFGLRKQNLPHESIHTKFLPHKNFSDYGI